jgi:hypothetical protein
MHPTKLRQSEPAARAQPLDNLQCCSPRKWSCNHCRDLLHLHPVVRGGRVVEQTSPFRQGEGFDYLFVRLVNVSDATRECGDWHVAREHAARRPEQPNRLQHPWADLRHCPAKAEDALGPENLHCDVLAAGQPGNVASPRTETLLRQVDRPADQRQDESKSREASSHGCEIGKLCGEGLELTDKVVLPQCREAATPSGVGQQVRRWGEA